ncbi:hypothetical protein BaRGS_00024149 [Batillaria attramentaria]|uniref:Uncharacterized protein n=1 Tax=Batillaria attramentaria TaxID=370345 RepID=A0ABD0KC03_9CAEN
MKGCEESQVIHQWSTHDLVSNTCQPKSSTPGPTATTPRATCSKRPHSEDLVSNTCQPKSSTPGPTATTPRATCSKRPHSEDLVSNTCQPKSSTPGPTATTPRATCSKRPHSEDLTVEEKIRVAILTNLQIQLLVCRALEMSLIK